MVAYRKEQRKEFLGNFWFQLTQFKSARREKKGLRLVPLVTPPKDINKWGYWSLCLPLIPK